MSCEIIIGLEIHAQLSTVTKAFCRCPNRYGAPPNTLVCPRCLGMPGALPVLSQAVIEKAALLATAIGATIHARSKFDRKNYFYPDLPKGYQISQYDEPFSTGGEIEIATATGSKCIRITRAHIEEDAGKSSHLNDGSTVVDMNRCGVPLVEIVSEPDLRSTAEAAAYLTTVRELLRWVGVCDGNMEEGSLRCDANISIRKPGQESLNERAEIKNLNSIRGMERAVTAEVERQINIYAAGGTVTRATLLWDEELEEVRVMRRKEGADDYRYFPEPDLPELRITADYLDSIRARIGELPSQRRARYRNEFSLHPESVNFLTGDRAIGDYFDRVVECGAEPRSAANWLQGEVGRALSERGWTMAEFPLTPLALSSLLDLVRQEKINLTQAKDVFRRSLENGRDPAALVAELGLAQSASPDELRTIVENLLRAHPDELQKYRAGKKNLLGFFIGEAMKAAGGRANPKQVNQLVQELLNAEPIN
jgi:aspartyl-tRNA(Asn)/glutamyl-tRNA(Gln) amidotransferase subunit B